MACLTLPEHKEVPLPPQADNKSSPLYHTAASESLSLILMWEAESIAYICQSLSDDICTWYG